MDEDTEGRLRNGKATSGSSILHRDLEVPPLHVVSAKDSYLQLENGSRILDAAGGAAVACIGHCDDRVREAVYKQMGVMSYVHAQVYTATPPEELAKLLIDSAEGKMSHTLFMCSGKYSSFHHTKRSSSYPNTPGLGSEATEVALKLSRQYFLESKPSQPQRTVFISRKQSYHGATLAGLAISGHIARRTRYEPLMLQNMRRVSPCNAYRYRLNNEDDAMYVSRLAEELESEILQAGEDKVCAFVAETVVGAVRTSFNYPLNLSFKTC